MHPLSKACVTAVVLGVIVLVTPTAASAASYRFKVNLTVVQDTDWGQQVRHPAPGDGYCGSADVHWVYTGDGFGELRAKVIGARVTFRGTKRFMQSTEIRVPGTVRSDHSGYSIEQIGSDPQCDLPEPPRFPPDTGCNPLVRKPGVARSFLLANRGRLILTGGFYRRDKQACGDPSLFTGAVGMGGRPRRADVNALIANKRVRSIELSASDSKNPFGLKDLASFGANSETIAASGHGEARWSVKLTRLR